MNKAVLLADQLEGFLGHAAHYRLDPPLNGNEFVIVSANNTVMFSGPETYIFPSNEDAKVVSWGELDGSTRGTLQHQDALREAGYEITENGEPQ